MAGGRVKSGSNSPTEIEERRAALWSWVVVAILFGVPFITLVGLRVYTWVLVDTAAGWTVGQSIRALLLALPIAIPAALLWTWWDQR